MATERSPHQAWADGQRDALLALGYDLPDVQTRIQWILDNLPPDADPATHIFDDAALWQAPDEQVQDSRVAWLSNDNVAPRWKLILDAREEE